MLVRRSGPLAAWAVMLATALTAVAPACAQVQTVFNTALITQNSGLSDVGNIPHPFGNGTWVSLTNASKLARVLNGVATEHTIPTENAGPTAITVISTAVYFLESTANKVGAFNTSSNTFTEYNIPTANAGLTDIAYHPSLAVWLTEKAANKIGRIFIGGVGNPVGVATEFSVPTAAAGVHGIAVGPDAALWFTEFSAAKIGRISETGQITEFPVPGFAPEEIAVGSDGKLWFTDPNGKIGRMSTGGVVETLPLPAGSAPRGLVMGPDGFMWFSLPSRGRLARMNVAGKIDEFDIPGGMNDLGAVGIGPNGDVWFTRPASNRVGTIALPITTPRAGGILSTADPAGQSFLRFYNVAGPSGAVSVQLRDGMTGAALGTWTSPPHCDRCIGTVRHQCH